MQPKIRLTEFRIKYLYLILSLVVSFILQGQSLDAKCKNVEDSLLCKIEYFRGLDSFEQYYKSVDLLGEFYCTKGEIERLFGNSKNYNLLPKSSKDSLIFRKHLLYHSFNLQKYGGSVIEGQKYLLKAHDHVADKEILDKFAYKIEKKIASNYDRLNDYDKAYYFYLKVIKSLTANKENGSLSRVYADLGNSYIFNKKPKEGLSILKKGYALAQTSKSDKGIVANLTNLAEYYLNMNDFEKFNQYYNEAEFYIKRLKKDNKYFERLAGFQTLKGDFYLKNKLFEEALQYYFEALFNLKIRFEGSRSREISKLHTSISEIYKQKGDLSKLESSVNEGLDYLIPGVDKNTVPIRSDLYSENSFVDLFMLKSHILQKRFEQDHGFIHLNIALSYLDLASYVNIRLQNELTVEQSKLVSIEVNRNIVEESLKILMILYQNHPSDFYLKKASTYFWRSKNQNLIELNTRQKLKLSLNKNDLQMVESLEDSLLYLERFSKGTANKDNINILKIEVLNQLDEYLENGIQEHQNSNFPYIDYIVTDSVVFYLNNFSETPFGVILDQPKLNKLVEDVLSEIQNIAPEDALKIKLNQAFDMLFPMELNGIESLKVIPDKYLSALPFDLLVKEDYLIKSINIFYGISGFDESVYQGAAESESLYLVKPTYTEANKNRYEGELRSGNYFLPYLEPEIKQISSLWQGDHKVSSDGGFLKIMKEADDYNIFHYAGHAISFKDSSYLIYEDQYGVEKINENQITNWPNKFKLVVLSACQTGVGDYNLGEGFESLCSGFIKAGAESVIYSLWSLNDESTSTIVGNVYKYLIGGVEKSTALRNAKLEYLENANPMKRHPFYWSGFAMIGNNTPIAKKSNFLVLISIVFVLLTILLTYKIYKK